MGAEGALVLTEAMPSSAEVDAAVDDLSIDWQSSGLWDANLRQGQRALAPALTPALTTCLTGSVTIVLVSFMAAMASS